MIGYYDREKKDGAEARLLQSRPFRSIKAVSLRQLQVSCKGGVAAVFSAEQRYSVQPEMR